MVFCSQTGCNIKPSTIIYVVVVDRKTDLIASYISLYLTVHFEAMKVNSDNK